MASTSRWKCMQPLGRPVVPEVKAISATSSAAVSTARYGSGRRAGERAAGRPGASPPYVVIRSPGTSALARSSTDRTSHSAWLHPGDRADRGAARAARCAASTVTATAPAFSTASQQAASQGVVGPRSSTRLPGTTPSSPVRTWAIAVDAVAQLPVGPDRRRRACGRRGGAGSACRRAARRRSSAGRGSAARAGRRGARATGRAAAGGRARRCRRGPRCRQVSMAVPGSMAVRPLAVVGAVVGWSHASVSCW